LEGSRSFKVIDVYKSKSLSTVLVMISSKYVPTCICNRFHTIRANNSKINLFRSGGGVVFLFGVLVQGEVPHPGARNFVAIN